MADGDEIEAGTIGNEGVVGVPALMDGDTPFVETFVQIPGSGLRCRSIGFGASSRATEVSPRRCPSTRATS